MTISLEAREVDRLAKRDILTPILVGKTTPLGKDSLDEDFEQVSAKPVWAAPAVAVSSGVLASIQSVLEFAIVISSAIVGKLIYVDAFLAEDRSTQPYLLLALPLATIVILFYEDLGLYEPRAMRDPSIAIGKLWGGLALAFLVVLGGLYLLKAADFYSRGWMLSWFMLSGGLLWMSRTAMRLHVKRLLADGRLRESIAIFGDVELGRKLKLHFECKCPEVEVKGLYSDEFGKSALHHKDVEGGLARLIAGARNGDFGAIMVAFPVTESKRISIAIRQLGVLPIEIQLCTDITPAPYTRAVTGARLQGDVRIDVVSKRPLSERYRFLKMCIDYTFAALALVLLSPLMVLIAAAIRLDSKGNALFWQKRYGYDHRVFWICKFRTMTVTQDDDIVMQASENDPRVTRVGRFLRRTSLDELPQLINVLRGEMSIVGPRPRALTHNEAFARWLELYPWRHRIKPGITGWAQSHGFRGEIKTREDIQKCVEYDLYYIDNWSLWMDIEIIIRTVFIVFSARRAY